jgi:threonine dehydrogenase-like Zn-dependent dehydrogenase
MKGTFALAVECSGHEQALLDAANAIRKRGEVVCIATPWRRFTDLHLHDLHHAIFHNYAVIRSGWEWEMPHHSEPFRSGSIFENLSGALRWLEEGRVSVEGIYSNYSPSDAQQAYQDLLNKKTDRLAVVFDWNSFNG